MRLYVNVDHTATLREARGTIYPDPVEAALAAIEGGADGITIHLREDRRHIKDRDVFRMKETIKVPLNLEMAASDEIISIALEVRPHTSTIVPERRQERTTERGLVLDEKDSGVTSDKIMKLKSAGIKVSLFIEPEVEVIEKAAKLGADRVELHTGKYCNLSSEEERKRELERLKQAAEKADKLGLLVAAGHGLDYENVKPVAQIHLLEELSIGHSIVCRAIMVGMKNAVAEMKKIIEQFSNG